MRPTNLYAVGEVLRLLPGARSSETAAPSVAPDLAVSFTENPVPASGGLVTIRVTATVGGVPVPSSAGTIFIGYDGLYHAGDQGAPDENGEFSIGLMPGVLGAGSHPIIVTFLANAGYSDVIDYSGGSLVVEEGLSSGSTMFRVPADSNLNDATGNLSTLAANGAAVDATAPLFGAGCLIRNNLSGGSEWSRGPDLALPQGPYYTVEAWARHNAGGASNYPGHELWVIDAAGYPLAQIFFNIGPEFRANVYDSANNITNLNAGMVGFVVDEWFHIALSVYLNKAALYWNGTRLATATLPSTARTAFKRIQAWGHTSKIVRYDDIRVTDWNPYRGATYTVPTGPLM